MKNKIYFDNASTTPLLPEVADLMSKISLENYGNPSSIHSFGRSSRTIIEQARKKISKIINASLGEIFFTSSATEANNTILKRAIKDLGVQRFISSPTEHHCIIHSLDSIAKENNTIEVQYLNVNNAGVIDLDQLEVLLSDGKKSMVSIMYGNNELGNFQPIDQISQLCVKYQAYFHCDAVQVAGKYEIDVQSIYFSFLTATAHKFHGPKGVGFFYMNSQNIISPYIHGGAQERNMRAGTENIAAIAGMSLALDMASSQMHDRKEKVLKLKEFFESRVLNELKDIIIHATAVPRLYHISSISFPDTPSADMLTLNLDIAGVAVSSGSACSAGIEEDSHVLVAIGHEPKRKTTRFSFSYMNTMTEVDMVVNILKKLSPSNDV
ncbi:MAG: hypothetical protein RLZZ546_1929 [Bacteroidota bacterium]|jgi:cysteine desulfurase